MRGHDSKRAAAALQADHRVRRHEVQRLADTEERPHGPGRAGAGRGEATGPAGRASGLRPDRRRRARAGAGGAPRCPRPIFRPETLRRRLNDELPADINVLAVGSAQPALPCPARRRGAQLHLPDCAAAHGLRQAVRVVGEGRPGRRAHARRRAGLRRLPRLPVVHRRRPGAEVHAGAARRARDLRRRGPAGDPHRRGRTSSGRWCGGSSASSSRWAAAAWRAPTPTACCGEPSPAVATLTAPASGLFLERVFYADEPHDTPVRAAVRVAHAEF